MKKIHTLDYTPASIHEGAHPFKKKLLNPTEGEKIEIGDF